VARRLAVVYIKKILLLKREQFALKKILSLKKGFVLKKNSFV